MKLAITYLLLFTYATIMLKPLLPYCSDVIAHVFWYKDHMATVHSHNGKFHVHKEVMEASKNSSAEKDATILKRDGSANDHIITKEFNISATEILIPNYFASPSPTLTYTYLNSDYPPPKV